MQGVTDVEDCEGKSVRAVYDGWCVDYGAGWRKLPQVGFPAVSTGDLRRSVSCAEAPYKCMNLQASNLGRDLGSNVQSPTNT
jgi:hypothetical protein